MKAQRFFRFKLIGITAIAVACVCTLNIARAQGPGPSVLNLPAKKITKVTQPRQMENLGRGMIAVHKGGDTVYVGWRMLGTEPQNIAFNLYRKTGNTAPVKLNKAPITQSTNYVDTKVDITKTNAYFVKVVKGTVSSPPVNRLRWLLIRR
jgi:molecular chaperone DnaK (HSP70)